MKYSRLLKWVNIHKHKVDAEGNLNEKYLAWRRSCNHSEASIEKEQNKLKTEYKRLKKLDEESPEEWIDYTAYEAIFTPEEREKFNPDGSLRVEYVATITDDAIFRGLEVESRHKMIDVESFNKVVESWAARGVNFAKSEKESYEKLNKSAFASLNERELTDLRNFEEISSLTIGIEPDEYHEYTDL